MQYFREKLKMGVFDMIYVVTAVTIKEDILMQDFVLKYFLRMLAVAIRMKTSSKVNDMLLSLYLEVLIIYSSKC